MDFWSQGVHAEGRRLCAQNLRAALMVSVKAQTHQPYNYSKQSAVHSPLSSTTLYLSGLGLFRSNSLQTDFSFLPSLLSHLLSLPLSTKESPRGKSTALGFVPQILEHLPVVGGGVCILWRFREWCSVLLNSNLKLILTISVRHSLRISSQWHLGFVDSFQVSFWSYSSCL